MTVFFSGKVGFQTADITVASGTQTSGVITLNGFGMVGLILPAALTSTVMTFQGSQDNTTFNALYNTSGTLLSIVIAPSRIVLFVPGDFVGLNYLKLILGTAEGADRIIKVVSRSFL